MQGDVFLNEKIMRESRLNNISLDKGNGDSVFRGWVGLRTQVVGTNIAVHIKLVTPHLVRLTS